MEIVILFALLIGILKWIQDTLSFRLPFDNWKTAFSKIKNQKVLNWINPQVSWKNKHEWFKDSKILTWLFSNPLVAITDAWHCIELFRNFTPYILFSILGNNYYIMLFYLLQIMIFHVLFTYTNKKSK